MLKYLAVLALPFSILGATEFSRFCECDGWTRWSPRKEIAPSFWISGSDGREHDSALKIDTKSPAEFGAWKISIPNLESHKTYRLNVWYQTSSVTNEAHSVAPRLEWFDSDGKSLRPAEFGLGNATSNGWRKVEIISAAPANAASAEVQLGFGFASNASISWDDFSFTELKEPRDRTVNVFTVFHRPRNTQSPAESVEQFCAIAAGARNADILCLPEGITVVGTDRTYADVSEPIPGPTSARLGKLARELHSYIVAGIYERDGNIVYNTALLIGRDGQVVGKYRKTHLPREEWEAGITPGDSYPVFDTDFGKVGLIICWDVQFPEPARAMSAKGAELLLLPIWGGNETLARARAIENHVFLVSSSYDMKSFVVNPEGKALVEASLSQPLVSATLHLDEKIYQWWLGDMKARTWRERRPDIHVD